MGKESSDDKHGKALSHPEFVFEKIQAAGSPQA